MVFNKQKFVIALVCAALGWIVGFQMGKEHEKKSALNRVEDSFGFNPFMFSNPIEEEPSWWEKFFKNPKNLRGKIIDNGMSLFGGGLIGDFKTHEDDKFVYYELDMDNVAKDSLNVRVENGMVVVEGNETKESFGATMSSSFHRAFPAPDGVDANAVQMDYVGKTLVIKFPKLAH